MFFKTHSHIKNMKFIERVNEQRDLKGRARVPSSGFNWSKSNLIFFNPLIVVIVAKIPFIIIFNPFLFTLSNTTILNRSE